MASNQPENTIDDLLYEVFSNGRDELTSDFRIEEAKAALSAMLNQVIGDDEVFVDIPVLNHLGEVTSVVHGDSYTPHMLARNFLRADQRQRAAKLGLNLNKEDK